jgi:hypothetical protein
LLVREVVRLVFYLPHDHHELHPQVSRALDLYVESLGLGQGVFTHGEDLDGERFPLTPDGWDHIRKLLRPFEGYRFIDEFTSEDDTRRLRTQLKTQSEVSFLLTGDTPQPNGFSFSYRARLPWRTPTPGSVSTLSATLPTERLEEHGPDKVRKLAMELASLLSFSTGHVGLALEMYGSASRALPLVREALFRYPGLDVPQVDIDSNLEARVDGVHWLNFLGPPVHGALGGVAGLWSRLHSPGTHVQALGEERMVITLGTWPEAGDLSQGLDLPAYRELARVLEPWLYGFEPFHALTMTGYTEADVRRWWRRFLD